MIAGPATTLEWILALAGVATFLSFALGLRGFFVRPDGGDRTTAFVQEAAIACAVIHVVGLLSRRSPTDAWAAAGIAMYVLAMVMFLDGIDKARGTVLVLESASYRVRLSFVAACAAGPVGTHSPTLIITAVFLIGLYFVNLTRTR